MIAPWYIDTPLVNAAGRILLAGAGKGKLEDVVDAGTRLMSDTTIVGRALVVGPRAKVDDFGDLLPPSNTPSDKEQAVWECYPHDMEDVGMLFHEWKKRTTANNVQTYSQSEWSDSSMLSK